MKAVYFNKCTAFYFIYLPLYFTNIFALKYSQITISVIPITAIIPPITYILANSLFTMCVITFENAQLNINMLFTTIAVPEYKFNITKNAPATVKLIPNTGLFILNTITPNVIDIITNIHTKIVNIVLALLIYFPI